MFQYSSFVHQIFLHKSSKSLSAKGHSGVCASCRVLALIVAFSLTALVFSGCQPTAPGADGANTIPSTSFPVQDGMFGLGTVTSTHFDGTLLVSSYCWFLGMGMFHGAPLNFTLDDERLRGMEITIDVSVQHGSFYGDTHNDKFPTDEFGNASLKDVYYGRSFTIDNGESIFWTDLELDDEAEKMGLSAEEMLEQLGNIIYADAIFKADGHIIGYAIAAIRCSNGDYLARVCDAKSYLLEDGSFQDISIEQVRQEIAESIAAQG